MSRPQELARAVGGDFRVTGNTTFTSGEGLELLYLGGNGYMQAYDRTGSAYKGLYLDGSSVNLRVSGGNVLQLTSSEVKVPVNTIRGTNASYLAMIMDTNTKTAHFCGGPGAAAASGAFISCFGNAHATTPGKMNIVPGSAGEVYLYNSNTALVMNTNTTGTYFSQQAQFIASNAIQCTPQSAQTSYLAPNTFVGEFNTTGMGYLSFGGTGSGSNVGFYIRTTNASSQQAVIQANYNAALLELTAYYARFGSRTINTSNGWFTLNSSTTLAWGHFGYMLYHNSSTHTWTIPPDSTTNFPIGTTWEVSNHSGAGNLTIAQGSGVSLFSNGAGATVGYANKTVSPGYHCKLIKVGANVWMIAHSGGVA